MEGDWRYCNQSPLLCYGWGKQSNWLYLFFLESHWVFGLDGVTFARVDRSDCEKRMSMYIIAVTNNKPPPDNEMPFHVDRRDDHLKKWYIENARRADQNTTTCLFERNTISSKISNIEYFRQSTDWKTATVQVFLTSFSAMFYNLNWNFIIELEPSCYY